MQEDTKPVVLDAATPMSNEHVNVVAAKDGYQHPNAVLARIDQYVDRYGAENTVTLLLYEAQKAIRELQSQLRVHSWISVQDQLPVDGQSVAFVVSTKSPTWEYLHGKVLGGTYWKSTFGGDFSIPGLTITASHWLPLPPAPEKDNG
jgi:hypothetical protein